MARINFDYRPTPEQRGFNWQAQLPEGFAIKRMDRELTSELQGTLASAGIPSWFDEYWGGIAQFLVGGFGFVVVGLEGIASNCRTPWVKDGFAPLQVSTRVYARGRGLATAVSGAFIEHCLANGLTPEYSCEEENWASIALAKKLGFVV